ncbi:glycoprotein glucosyltransferase [Drechslerella dactyloides]|uniref:Glycoprotein glucosyltransferase n=1 Tax=Drechslerella dactyloides TaxID=74499 RepID=A0AAD6IUK0_DREDA|nr:glycoprotein glucosyltransferase [Drechslerella dactyloides]
MWFSTLWSQRLSARALFSSALALASLQQAYGRSQPHEILEEGAVKRWEGLNLSLKTSWKAGPYILEILECAALENHDFYFTLLKLIGSETIKLARSDKDIYESLVSYVEKNELLDHHYIPTWKFCISLRETSPRIEAHYQYFLNNVEFSKGESCPVWFDDGTRQSCNADDIAKVKPESSSAARTKEIAFDRLSTDDVRKGAVAFYIDILADGFPAAYKKMVEAAEKAGVAYKIRYRPSPSLQDTKPIALSGYGVSLVLKKTDYMVIDDRGAKEGASDDSASSSSESSASSATPSPQYKFRVPKNLEPQEQRFPLWDLEDIDDPVKGLRDILPLSQKNLADLGFKTANFISKSGIYPPDMLMKISSDFPKYAHTIGTMGGVQDAFLEEHIENRKTWLPSGYNAMILNGLMLDPSEVTATTLLEIMRRERKYTMQIRSLGLDQKETLDLIIHENITESKLNEEKPRFDWREQENEKGAIIWLNDFEKDEMYENWPDSINNIMVPTYGGQLASIRKNIHTLILPLDFSNRDDVILLSQRLFMFLKRGLALRIGIIPVVRNNLGSVNSKVFAALLDSYDLAAAMSYLKDGLEADKHGVRYPAPEYIQHVTGGRSPKDGKDTPTLSSVMESKELQENSRAAGQWESRLGVTSRPYPFFINGIGQSFSDSWINVLTTALPIDVQRMQVAVEAGDLSDESDIAEFLLEGKPLMRRNPVIFLDEDVNMVDLFDLYEANSDIMNKLPHFPGTFVEESETSSADVWVIGDFDIANGHDLLSEAAKFQTTVPGISITAIHNPSYKTKVPTLSALLHSLVGKDKVLESTGVLEKIADEVRPQKDFVDMKIDGSKIDALGQKILGGDAKTDSWVFPDQVIAENFWREAAALFERKLKIKPGQRAVLVNGRLLGPFGDEIQFTKEDFNTLVNVELKARIQPVLQAVKSMGALDRLRAPNAKGKLTSAMAVLQTPQTTGIINRSSNVRTNMPSRWKKRKTALTSGDPIWSTFRFIVSLDPLSETAQKWAPILRVLMSMDGVGIYTFLNPREDLGEVPIKRFYRHVLYSQPKFDENGDILEPKAQFTDLPDKTLYSLSMDVPPTWLVTPSETIHDLDNIKLQTFKERFGTSDLNATYSLRSILIEGHSRDTSLNEPSAGAQLELGTAKNPVMEDTLIMQNLGYFQFKSNPGYWQIRLKPGRSSEVFSIQSLGMDGFSMADSAEDDVKEVTLMSLRGVTLFPRLKRNKGYMKADVLAPLPDEESPIEKGKKLADGFLSKLGFGKSKEKETKIAKPPAEINIFSVASGHLYERFLNIMMISVMRHTKHTVKFWFIENFLSPAFKDFIPTMAKEYGFEYELVTYKWPHWLRQQKEKQREIWGYKILFLDVLFPLNLDKIIFVDADQIVRTDMKELVDLDLEGAPYGFAPMCDSRTEIEGFRFWKQGYWKSFLGDLKYHISALFVVDLKLFRQLAAGDRLRQQYHQLSADPNSLANLDQDLPNNMQRFLPIFSLPQDWLWCETWCSDESFATAKTIDLCNNPMTKEPKLDRAKRQIPEWTEYDNEVAELAKRVKAKGVENMREALVQKEALGEEEKAGKEEKTESREAAKDTTGESTKVPTRDEL